MAFVSIRISNFATQNLCFTIARALFGYDFPIGRDSINSGEYRKYDTPGKCISHPKIPPFPYARPDRLINALGKIGGVRAKKRTTAPDNILLVLIHILMHLAHFFSFHFA